MQVQLQVWRCGGGGQCGSRRCCSCAHDAPSPLSSPSCLATALTAHPAPPHPQPRPLRFETAKKKGDYDDDTRRRENAKASLERYMHYFERFDAHSKAREKVGPCVGMCAAGGWRCVCS